MALCLRKRFQQTKPEVPGRRDLLNQIGTQRITESCIHCYRQIDNDLFQAAGTDTTAGNFSQRRSDLIEFAGQYIVVRLERVEHVPDRLEVACLDGSLGVVAVGNEYRENDGSGFLVRAQPNGAAHGLDDVHLTATRIDKCHAVERGNVDAFGKAACIAQYSALPCGQCREPVELRFSFARRHVARNEVSIQGSGGAVFGADPGQDVRKVSGKSLGAIDAVVEADDALEVIVLDGLEQANARREGLGIGFNARVGGHQRAIFDPSGNGRIVDADNHDLIIGKQSPGNGFAKWQGMQYLTKQGRVVHAHHVHAAIRRRFLDVAGIGARGGRGKQPLVAANPGIVENGRELGANLSRAAMGFVRDGQIEGGNAVIHLCLRDDRGGLVGGENYALACTDEEAPDLFGIGCHRKGKVGHGMDGFVRTFCTDGLVGADAEHFKRLGGGKRPFTQYLRQQPEGWNQHQRKPCGEVFPDPQGGIGLPCAAGHDELASLGGFQAFGNGRDGFALMFTRLRPGLAPRLRQHVKVGRVFQLCMLEIRQQEVNDRLFLCLADLFGVAANEVCRGDQQAVRNTRSVGFAEELIDVMLGDVVVRRVALRLHGPDAAVLVPEHKIDATVGAPAIRVLVPEPHLIDLSRPFRIGLQEPFDEMLKLLTPFDGIGIEALIEVGKLAGHLVDQELGKTLECKTGLFWCQMNEETCPPKQ
ncbi:MAG: hypothetical protein A2040_06670 [Rhodocyclales bacterium GWA2_65_19]|nr:MAG: hypothetical protein A2040_06670 [Rhodocyclales bacterium GWA2_65_19]